MSTKNKSNEHRLDKIPTWKLEEILNHPHTQGIDGADYGRSIEEIQSILWARYNKESDQSMHQHEQYQKELFKHEHNITKKPKKAKGTK